MQRKIKANTSRQDAHFSDRHTLRREGFALYVYFFLDDTPFNFEADVVVAVASPVCARSRFAPFSVT